MVDLQRTKHPLTGEPITSEFTKSLFEILQAIAFVLPEIGYCQGMNYIAAAFFANLEDEELTFDIFMALIVSKRLMPLF